MLAEGAADSMSLGDPALTAGDAVVDDEAEAVVVAALFEEGVSNLVEEEEEGGAAPGLDGAAPGLEGAASSSRKAVSRSATTPAAFLARPLDIFWYKLPILNMALARFCRRSEVDSSSYKILAHTALVTSSISITPIRHMAVMPCFFNFSSNAAT